MSEQVKPGELTAIKGLPGIWRRIPENFNRFALIRVCPNCGSSGIIKGDWFSCGGCHCVAVVASGEAFVRVQEIPKSAQPI